MKVTGFLLGVPLAEPLTAAAVVGHQPEQAQSVPPATETLGCIKWITTDQPLLQKTDVVGWGGCDKGAIDLMDATAPSLAQGQSSFCCAECRKLLIHSHSTAREGLTALGPK